jgi:hypothetical protein
MCLALVFWSCTRTSPASVLLTTILHRSTHPGATSNLLIKPPAKDLRYNEVSPLSAFKAEASLSGQYTGTVCVCDTLRYVSLWRNAIHIYMHHAKQQIL